MSQQFSEKPRMPQLGALIRKRRKDMGMTMQELADKAGVSVGYVSQIERDIAVPTLGTLAQVAQALDSTIDYFVKPQRPVDGFSKKGARPTFLVSGSSIVYETVTNDFPGSEISSYILNVPAGYQSETVSHQGEEILFILEGTIHQVVDGQVFEMTQGDSLHFDGSLPHSWSNPTDATARVLWTGKLQILQSQNGARYPLGKVTS